MRTLAAAALAATTLTLPAAAAPAPACHLVKDPVQDATALANGVAAPRNDDAMDITELDLASDARSVTAVVRAYALDAVDTMAPTGRLFTVAFTVRGKAYRVRMLLAMDGTPSSDAGVAPVVDATAYELRVTVPLATFGLKGLRARDRFTRLEATSVRWLGELEGGRQVGDVVDTAAGAVTYAHLGRSCVRVGR